MSSPIEQWKQDRQKARTDLYWLCTEVLRYRDLEPEVHKPICDHLQKFSGGTDEVDAKGHVRFEPAVPVWEMSTEPRGRKRLLLYPRGHLKTTIATIAHNIQWILNYPDIRVLLTTATGDQVTKMLSEIRAHFQWNEYFRFLFPEYCPAAKKAAEFGNQESFTVPCRRRKWLKEPTMSACSVGKVIAGGHYEHVCYSDIVDKENIKTPGAIQEVIDHFRYSDPLVERGPIYPHHGWITVEGTRYDFSDLYGTIEDAEEKRVEAGKEGEWSILVGDAEVDAQLKTTLWPTRFPWTELKKMETNLGSFIYSCQMRNKPIPTSGGLASKEQVIFVPRELLKRIPLRLHVTVDLHGMEDNAGNDYTVLTLAGFDNDGRCWIIDIDRGHFSPFEIIEKIFALHAKHPRIIDFKIEKDAHARVLLPFLKRAMAKSKRYPVITPMRRDNRTSKKNRIKGLQPWFEAKVLRFAEDLDCKVDLLQEILRFPKYKHDDILDTLADQMQNRDGTGVLDDVIPGERSLQIPIQRPEDQFIGFDPLSHEQVWLLDQMSPVSCYHERTGL